jgi:hypothetical protein
LVKKAAALGLGVFHTVTSHTDQPESPLYWLYSSTWLYRPHWYINGEKKYVQTRFIIDYRNESVGELTMCGIDPARYTGKITYVNLTQPYKPPAQFFWAIHVDALVFSKIFLKHLKIYSNLNI